MKKHLEYHLLQTETKIQEMKKTISNIWHIKSHFLEQNIDLT